MIRRAVVVGLVLLASSLSPIRAAHADGGSLTITRQQYQLYKDYQDALQDPRVEKMKEKDRLPAIAHNFKVKEKELKAAVEKGDAEASQVEAIETAALKEAFKGTPLDGHLGEIRVDASKGHIVSYVQWYNSDTSKLDQEACYAATRAIKAATLTGTVYLYANDATAKDKKVYSSLISAENALRIKEDQIVDFALTRYKGLFEKRQVFASTGP
jgi:hypothetical protein